MMEAFNLQLYCFQPSLQEAENDAMHNPTRKRIEPRPPESERYVCIETAGPAVAFAFMHQCLLDFIRSSQKQGFF